MISSALEDEIKELEAEVQRARSSLDSSKRRHSIVVGFEDSVSHNETLSGSVISSKSSAVHREQDFAILNGLGRMKPTKMSEEQLAFQFIGPSPSACIVVSFDTSGPTITCKASVEPGLFGQYEGHTLKGVSSFLQTNVTSICSATSERTLDTGEMIPGFLRELEWSMCRLEQTAAELSLLLRRYQARLICQDGLNSLLVEFQGRKGGINLMARFLLTKAYPFSPVDVELDHFEGDIDMSGMQNLLIERAKPGFGYLSRTCDVIAAFVYQAGAP